MRTSLAPQGVGLGPGPAAVYVSLRGFCLSLFFIGKILVYFVLCRPIGGSSFRPSSGYCLVTYFRPPAHETMPHPPLSSLLCFHDANQPSFDSGFTLRCNWICCNPPSSGYCLVTYFRPPAHETMPHPPLCSLLCVHDANQPRLDSGFTLRCNWVCCN